VNERANGFPYLRLISVAIAVILWLFITVERRGERPAEKVVESTVTYNPPPGIIILNPVERVRVRLRGGDRAIRHLNPVLVDVQVELRDQDRGLVEVQLQTENVLTPEGIEVISIEPNFLRLRLDEETRRLLPVRARLVGEPAEGAEIIGRPRVRPPQVLVQGPATLVGTLDYLETSPVSLDGRLQDFEESTLVVSPDPLIKILESPVVDVLVAVRAPPALEEDEPAGEGDA
jgi:YbbR domain-containing protein